MGEAEEFTTFDENKFSFNTDEENVSGSYELTVTLTNSAGSNDYHLDVNIYGAPYFDEEEWEEKEVIQLKQNEN